MPADAAGKIGLSGAVSSSLGIASTAMGALGSAQPVLGLIGGMVSLLGPKIDALSPPPPDKGGETTRMLQAWINSTIDAMEGEVETVRKAVFGAPGGNQYTGIAETYKVKNYKS